MSIIKQKRKELELSRRQLANKLHVHPQVIVRWESKEQMPSILMVPIIKKHLGITLKDLINDYNIGKEDK